MNEPREQLPCETLQQLAAKVAQLRERVEDLEDTHELDATIGRNADKPLICWDDARQDLGLK